MDFCLGRDGEVQLRCPTITDQHCESRRSRISAADVAALASTPTRCRQPLRRAHFDSRQPNVPAGVQPCKVRRGTGEKVLHLLHGRATAEPLAPIATRAVRLHNPSAAHPAPTLADFRRSESEYPRRTLVFDQHVQRPATYHHLAVACRWTC